MKIKLKLPAIVLGLMLLTGFTTVKAQDDNVSLQQFYDELSPYGTWIQDPQYGYVWRPDVDQSEFRPYYTNGRWVMTEYGNTWVSNYNWGWAPFHYGRWIYDRYNRWVWLPDTTWGPAWVDWRSGDGYYGWAPMGPSINIHVNIGRRYYRPDICWNFVPMHNIYYTSFPRYRSYNNVRIINRTKIINNTYIYNNRTYYTGPRQEEIRRATNQDVRVYSLARNSRADAPQIDRNTVNIYTPRPTRSSNQGPAAPRSVGTYSANGRQDNRVSNNGRDNTVNQRDERGGVSSPGRVNERVTGRSDAPVNRDGQNQRMDRPDRSNLPVTRTEPTAPGRQEANPRREQPEQIMQRQDRQMQSTQNNERRQQRQQEQPQRQQQPERQQRQERPQVQQQRPQQSPPQRSEGRQSGGGRQESGRPGRG